MRTLIRNIGTLVSGDIHRPILDADSVQIDGGRIAAVGKGLDDGADTVILEQGQARYEGTVAELTADPQVRQQYLMV